MHTLDFTETQNTRQKILKPSIIINYNKNMDGVDVDDQMLNKFHTMLTCKSL